MGRLLAALALLALSGTSVRADAFRYGARTETGAEYDSNPGRLERVHDDPSPAPVEASSLARLVLSVDLAAAISARQAATLSAGAAGKLFLRDSARGEDVLVAHALGAWIFRPLPSASLSIEGGYYDVFQRGRAEARDFRSLSPGLRWRQALGESWSLGVGGGFRAFTFKPQPDFDFRGPTAFVEIRQLFTSDSREGADWEWSADGSVEMRLFDGIRCTSANVCPGLSGSGRREDRFWAVHAEVTRTSGFLLGAGTALHLNRSNSYGGALLRGIGYARAVFLLPWQISMGTRAELVATRYEDSLPLVTNIVTGMPLASIEDESRSVLRIELVRPFGTHLEAGFRYTFYTNELRTSAAQFRRHTGLAFVALLADG